MTLFYHIFINVMEIVISFPMGLRKKFVDKQEFVSKTKKKFESDRKGQKGQSDIFALYSNRGLDIIGEIKDFSTPVVLNLGRYPFGG